MTDVRTTTRTHRPGPVTAVVVLVLAGGIAALTSGILALTVVNAAAVVGVLLLAWGAAYLALAHGLAEGREWARFTVAAMSVAELLGSVFALVRGPAALQEAAVVAGLLSAVVLVALCSPRATAYFRTSPVTTPCAPLPLVSTPGVR